ncbi:H-NS histone family protein (plasmid) [Burkholderia sp. FERM BP-3421]|uniref:H-NS histone family protein n=1 Tax=Burkholderia sp. FERM BP-3421 TaxID=1494466 RepID=UPI002362732A|nr:H-NS histone family protein [Burkholderia sp. FERM BP-3421]WDD90190.1 H-NS histone family protein [Burkholderia sp. FERM BP-3421]
MVARKRTLSDVKAQIEALEAEAEALRAAEIKEVIADVRAKVAAYGLTEKDVFGRRRVGGTPGGRKVTTPSMPRYRDPKSGATWSGKGRAPAWIAAAKNRTRFLISE